jgi:pyruvate ferredoxin oxidoreductase gamma subunit
MKEIIWHGRGGQGVVLASSILGTASAIYEDKYAMSIPSFGAERRGAPLIAITRISETPIHRRNLTADPDYIVILDDSLVLTALANCSHEKSRHIIVNSKKTTIETHPAYRQSTTIIDAEATSLEILGWPITNTVMLGVLSAVTDLVRIQSIRRAIADVMGPDMAQKNILAADAGFRAVNRV